MIMKRLIFFLSMFLPLYLFAQGNSARNPSVIVVPFVEPGDGENDRIKEAVLNDEAVPLALSKIKEQFNLRSFNTIDFMTEFQRVQNRSYAASALNAKSTGLQAYVDGARADIYVTVKISKEDFDGGASNVTLLLEAKERETGFSLANASVVSDRFRASKKELTEYALEGITENFFNQLKLAFRDMVNNGREVNVTLNVDENCEFDMENDVVGTQDMTLSEELDEWVLNNAFKGNGEVRWGGNSLNVFMRVPVYDSETGRPRSISSEVGKMRRFISGLLKSKGYTASSKAASGQYIQLLIQNSRE